MCKCVSIQLYLFAHCQIQIKPAGFASTITCQAIEFASRYDLLHHQENTFSGFSATLLKDSSGKKILAIRGTEITNINDLYADSNIAVSAYTNPSRRQT